ncbi:unnamed protein product [Parnassius apollo]|uniref:(apollo) hypothetical protein n=1 Tax=Parnassius apollo TaxID=110799 RepID=A0A8S3YH59_PARAO|nr:unnamed protein product [Parnassius apollo]
MRATRSVCARRMDISLSSRFVQKQCQFTFRNLFNFDNLVVPKNGQKCIKGYNANNINAVTLATYDDIITETGTVCGYGVDEDNSPGEQLVCSEWILEPLEVGTTVGISEGVPPTRYDIGAPLVSNGVQIGVLTSLVEGPTAVFKNPAIYRDWIKEQTGVEL